jgi:NADPH:quinone reductase-like Zn-dependent oxidoreductase
MKAAVYTRYGPPDAIQITDVEKPVPKDNEVLLKVRAASVNPLDAGLMKGKPHSFRILFGLRKPRLTRPGVDVAGQVEAVGRNVMQFKPGDEVFGMCKGAFAEYACAPESGLSIKPANLTFEQAASAPVAALTALQGLRDKGHIQPGQKVLINGAAGGVGTFAVQIAKSFGADVTGVCSTRNVEIVRSIGADQVIDYTRQDFTESGKRYDLIFDCFVNHSLSACRRALNPQGLYLMVGAPPKRWMIDILAPVIKALVLSLFVSQKFVVYIARSSREDLTTMSELMASGKVKPVIDKRYKLSEVPEAIQYLEQRHARGKVIITLAYNNKT